MTVIQCDPKSHLVRMTNIKLNSNQTTHNLVAMMCINGPVILGYFVNPQNVPIENLKLKLNNFMNHQKFVSYRVRRLFLRIFLQIYQALLYVSTRFFFSFFGSCIIAKSFFVWNFFRPDGFFWTVTLSLWPNYEMSVSAETETKQRLNDSEKVWR
jgi:hypothetical protein